MPTMRSFHRGRAVRALIQCVVLAVATSGFGLMPVSSASAAGAGVENFTMSGTWNCTYGCNLTSIWGIQGTAQTCVETEAEEFGGVDVQPAEACGGAYFTGDLHSTCVGSVCTETGGVEFYLPDNSDSGGGIIGPIRIEVTGVAELVNVTEAGQSEQGFVLTAAFGDADRFNGTPVLDWTGAGDIVGGGCSGTVGNCIVNRGFNAAVTGIEVDN